MSKIEDFPISEDLGVVISTIAAASGKPIAVGGCVRDHLLGLKPKDIDLEVYDISLDKLTESLKALGQVVSVGKSFGVLKFNLQGSKEIFDIALPRKENKSGQGHRGFVVETDETLSFKEASARRDFTINAMGVDLQSLELLDEHGGQADLKAKVLRHVSGAFAEDPLRVLRACQFAARFNLKLDQSTLELCRSMRPELDTLPSSRLCEEMKKLLLADKPSVGLALLKDTNALGLFPELESLIGCEQNPKWHPEGDVWVHTLMVVDEAAKIIRREKLAEEMALTIMLGALCHDLGKPLTLTVEDGIIRTKGHEPAGETPTRTFMSKCGFSQKLTDAVVPLVKEHLKPFALYAERDKISNAAIKRLASRVNIAQLCLVSEADFLGRTTEDALNGNDPSSPWLLAKAKELAVESAPLEPLILGRDLIELGFKPGPTLGKILGALYEEQLKETFADKFGAHDWLRAKYPKHFQ